MQKNPNPIIITAPPIRPSTNRSIGKPIKSIATKPSITNICGKGLSLLTPIFILQSDGII